MKSIPVKSTLIIYLIDKISIHKLIIIIALISISIFQYWDVFNYEMIDWDDGIQTTHNKLVNNKLSIKNVKAIFSSTVAAMYQPLTTLSFNIEKNIFGSSGLTFHTFSIVYHIVNTILLFWLMLLLFPSSNKYLLLIGCLIFAIHPINTEAVSWISARSTLLSATFYLFSTIFYLKYLNSEKILFFYITSICFFTLSLFSKVISISFVFIPFILDYLHGEYSINNVKKTFLNLSFKLPFILIASLFAFVTLKIRFDFIKNSISNQNFSNYDYILVILQQYKSYICNIFYPINLQPQYKDPVNIHLLNYLWLIPIGLTTIFLWKLRKNKTLILGVVIFFTSLFPVLKLKPMGHSFITDRYAYISVTGIIILVCYIFSKYNIKKMHYSLFGILLFVLSHLSFNNQKTWSNNISIWSKVIENEGVFNKNNFAYAYRANAYYRKGLFKKAINDLKKASNLTKNPTKKTEYLKRIEKICKESITCK